MRGRGRVNRSLTLLVPARRRWGFGCVLAIIGAGPARLLLASRVAARPPAENYVDLPLS